MSEFELCPKCGNSPVHEVKEYKQYAMNQGMTPSKPIVVRNWYQCGICGRRLKKLEEEK